MIFIPVLVQFNGLVPVVWIDILAVVVVMVIVFGVVYRFAFWVKVVPSGFFSEAKRYITTRGLVSLFFSELANRVFAQRKVLNDSKVRRTTHLMIFWGFLGLAFATVWDDVFFHDGSLPVPFSFDNLGNIVGNVSGFILLLGLTVVVLRYAFVGKFKGSAKGDLIFLIILYLATITGFATELTRFTGSTASLTYSNYLVHLGFVAALLLSAPFTHFFHALLTPFMRYVERIQDVLFQKGVTRYPFQKKTAMASLAEDVRDGKTKATYPSWLDREDESAKPSG